MYQQLQPCFFLLVIGAMTIFLLPTAAAAQRKYTEAEKETHTRVQSILNMIQDSDLQPQLELLDTQIEAVKKIYDEIQSMMSDDSAKTVAERQQKFDLIAKVILDAEPKLKKILLPHQLKILNEIHNLQYVRDRTGFGLNDASVRKTLKLTEEQQKKIADITKQSEKELKAEIKAIEDKILQVRKQHFEKMQKVLKPDQRKTYREKFGETPWRFWK